MPFTSVRCLGFSVTTLATSTDTFSINQIIRFKDKDKFCCFDLISLQDLILNNGDNSLDGISKSKELI